MNAIAPELALIVGDSGICNWDDLPPDWQEQIARVNGSEYSSVVYPSCVEELSEVMKCAYNKGWRVLPGGSGSKLGWGGIGKPVNLVLSTQRLNQVIDHAVGDLTVTAQAGVKFADLQAMLLKTGQFLPLEPAYPQNATLGGIIATADSGSWRHRYGGVRDMLLGISFVRSDGEVAKAGGRVVKNVAGYDLMKLFTGSFGTLGILTDVTFRLYPVQEASATVVLVGEADAIASTTKSLLASALTPTAADLLSTQLVTTLGLGQGMGLMVRFQSLSESVKEQSSRLLEVGQQLGLLGTLSTNSDETHLWKSLPEQIWAAPQHSGITCKIGVVPTAAVAMLTQLDTLTSGTGLGLIHAGSGLGNVRLDSATVKPETILEMRKHCQSHNGFLTILEAPVALKQQLDVWGYAGNALDMMRRIKEMFDPKDILSPQRFVGGI
ncbi:MULTISPECIES: FAD-binding oxidoreductase [unclassified Coleofasciculus]|uniref:FAD-binding oxidoreductase n=1 Tax=unclassified Coleofasciculus TaxID=2692782 RepID=UPI00187F795A|nr:MULTISPECIES: FAD-binding oxidoreductase [unclassified Coleofasciculus]MBE9127359.1 FAD-binding oxidoreductase [Coleofasciculus sp. LEGE 07081]MBE9150657.1 FAD-binding oxidoreductase [Coleofasciculus sp. LEGE 07092]